MTHDSTRDSWTLTGSLIPSLVAILLLCPGSWCAHGFVCALQESIFQVLWKFCNQIPLASKFKFPGGFPDSSVGKESTFNAGDPSSITGWGRFAGEAIGYPLQYSWASLVTQMVKNPPAMQETWVQFLGWEDPLEKGKSTQSSILAWRILAV